MPGEHKAVGSKCQGNAGEFRRMPGEVTEWVQSARGLQVNTGDCRYARGMYGSGCKVPGECREMPGECTGMPGERKGVGAKSRGMQGRAGECTRKPGECIGVGAKFQGNAWECRELHGNARECQGNVREWV